MHRQVPSTEWKLFSLTKVLGNPHRRNSRTGVSPMLTKYAFISRVRVQVQRDQARSGNDCQERAKVLRASFLRWCYQVSAWFWDPMSKICHEWKEGTEPHHQVCRVLQPGNVCDLNTTPFGEHRLLTSIRAQAQSHHQHHRDEGRNGFPSSSAGCHTYNEWP